MASAIDQHREAFQTDPSNDRAFEALEEHHFLAADWEGLATLYEHRLSAPYFKKNPKQRAQVLARLGQIFEERQGDADRAAAIYADAIQADPQLRVALTQLRGIHTRRGQWDVALQIAELEAECPLRPVELAAVLSDMGRIWLDQLGDPEHAAACFERARAASDAHRPAIQGLAEALERAGQAAGAADAWADLAVASRGRDRAQALVNQARISGELGRAEEAAELQRRALTDDPRNPQAIEAVANEASSKGQWVLLADLMERRFDLAASPGRRAEIAVEAGALQHRHLDNADVARVWLERAAELDPSNPVLYEAVADLERDSGDDAALLAALSRIVELRGDAAPVSVLLETASLLSDANLDGDALQCLERAMTENPDDALVLEAMTEVLERLGRHQELADLLERRAALTHVDESTRASVLAELASLQGERLGDSAAAREAWRGSFDANPAAPGVATSLAESLRKEEAWDDLRSVLEVAGDRGPDAEQPAFLRELGQLLAERFDEPDAARGALERALSLDPTHIESLSALQRLAVATGDEETILRAYEREAAVTTDPSRLATLVTELVAILEERDRSELALEWVERWVAAAPEDRRALSECARLRDALGRDDATVEALERLDPLLPEDERASNRRRIAARLAHCGRVEEAVTALERALEADADDLDTLRALATELERANRSDELAFIQRRLADLCAPPERARWLDALARLQVESLEQIEAAIDVLAELAEEDEAPDDVHERRETLLESAGRHEELVESLCARRAAPDLNPASAVALDLACARIHLDRLGRGDEAVRIYRTLLAEDPACSEAAVGIERAMRASGDTAGLADLLLERAEHADAPAERERCEFERAVLCADELERPDDADRILHELAASALDVNIRARAWERLDALRVARSDWEGLRSLLEGAIDDGTREDEAALRERLAILCRDQLDDSDAATSHFERIAELAPARAEVWQALARLYESAARPDDRVRAIECEIATNPPQDRRLTLHGTAAGICAESLADVERARGHFEAVLELDPSHAPAAEFLIDLHEREGRPESVAALLEGRLATTEAEVPGAERSARATSLRLRLAALRSGPLGDRDGAIADLEAALDASGPAAVAAPLAELYEQGEYWRDLAGLCRAAAEACDDSGERAGWLIRLGANLAEHGDPRDAADAYRRALTDRPDDTDASRALGELYRRLGEHESLARWLEAELSDCAGADEIPIRLELAGLHATHLDRREAALLHLTRVLEIEPRHEDARARAVSLAEGLARDDALLGLLGGSLAISREPAERASLLARRADTHLRLTDCEAAIGDYRSSLALDPESDAVRDRLRETLAELGRWHLVLRCDSEAAARAEGDARLTILDRAADLAWEKQGPDAALPWLLALREARPHNDEVSRRIAEAHQCAGRTEAYVTALSERAEHLTNRDERRRLHAERAAVIERELASPRRAASALEDALSVAPGDMAILRELDRLYTGLGRPLERVRILEALADAVDGDERGRIARTAAELCAGPLADPVRSARHWLVAVAASPTSGVERAERLRGLGDALAAAGQVEAWSRCAEEELQSLANDDRVFGERRVALHRALAHAYSGDLARPAAARGHWVAVLDDDARDPDLLDASSRDEAERELIALLRGERNPVELARRLEARLERDPDDASAWTELACIFDERLSSPAAAADAYRRALVSEPTSSSALRGLRGCAERLGRWSELAETLERELETVTEPASERGALLRRLGCLYANRLDATPRASRCFAAALEACPEDFESLHALQTLLQGMEDWRGALDLFESEIAMLGERDAERRSTVWLRVGEIARDHTGDLPHARRAYVAAAVAAPLAPPRRAELAELHAESGDLDAFAEVFESWCDDSESRAGVSDHTRLAEAFESLGRTDAALARVERAVGIDPSYARAWDAAARLHETRGTPAAASEALARAAELAGDGRGAARLEHAARLVASDDPVRAAALLRRAAALDPSDVGILRALARAADNAGDPASAERVAARALDVADTAGDDEAALILEAGLVGGSAARQLNRPDAATRFFRAALSIEPDHREALAGLGESLAETGDLRGAREYLERCLAMEGDDPDRARHLAVIGDAFAAEANPDAALRHYDEALGLDPGLDEAHAGRVRASEGANQIDDAIAALELWAEVPGHPAHRAERLLRAAELERRTNAPLLAIERHLREALEADPNRADAWAALADLLVDDDRSDEARHVATRALDGDLATESRAPLELVVGRVCERAGEVSQAIGAYGRAAETDPRCVTAALAEARLRRARGEWEQAADGLCTFADRHPGNDAAGLADVLRHLGRLLAGPLEDMEGAQSVYRRAVELDPECRETRLALAGLLGQLEDLRDEALDHFRTLLECDPTDGDALRGVLRLAAASNDAHGEQTGRAILAALGIGSPIDETGAAETLSVRTVGEPRLEDATFEALRRLAQDCADEIADALAASHAAAPAAGGDAGARFAAAALDAEGRLAAPALVPLSDSEVGNVFRIVAAVALEPDSVQGDGHLVNDLSAAFSRRARRRARRILGGTTLAEIESADFVRFRRELRALAAATAVDETGGDLATALRSLLRDADRTPESRAPNADLSPFVVAHPPARAVLVRAVEAWLGSVGSNA